MIEDEEFTEEERDEICKEHNYNCEFCPYGLFDLVGEELSPCYICTIHIKD